MRDPWEPIHAILRGAWPGGMDPYGPVQEQAYAMVLGEYPLPEIAHAVNALAKRGGQWRPSAAVIAREIEDVRHAHHAPAEFSVRLVEDAAYRTDGLDRIVRQLGREAGEWFRLEGRDLIRGLSLSDAHQFGHANQERVRNSWREFTERHRTRMSRGETRNNSLERAAESHGLHVVDELRRLEGGQ